MTRGASKLRTDSQGMSRGRFSSVLIRTATIAGKRLPSRATRSASLPTVRLFESSTAWFR